MKNLFRKYYALNASIVLIFTVLGFMSSRVFLHLTANPIEDHHAVFYARLVDELNPKDHAAALAKIKDWKPPLQLTLLDKNGNALFPKDSPIDLTWNSLEKPRTNYESISLRNQKSPGMHLLIRLPGETPEYLYASSERNRHGGNAIFMWSIGSLTVSVLLGIAFSMSLLFRSLRGKAQIADSVLAELQKGNLKARFPIKKMDEIGEAMNRFNLMADEIERLVAQLKAMETSRMRLLQELAHDLRTPLTSMKSLVETVLHQEDRLDKKVREEFLNLSLHEIDYLQRLVEDLLILARVSEPRYQLEQKFVPLPQLLQEEAEGVAASYQSNGKEVRLANRVISSSVQVAGDEHLLRRMIRNALDNAFSFANHEVSVALLIERNMAKIIIEDDGPGFPDPSVYSYGERRVSRSLESSSIGGRLSVGLGSVIIKTVAQSHGGSVLAGNIASEEGRSGARLVIYLPI